MTNSWKIRGNSCSSTQWLRQLAAIREIRRTHVNLTVKIKRETDLSDLSDSGAVIFPRFFQINQRQFDENK